MTAAPDEQRTDRRTELCSSCGAYLKTVDAAEISPFPLVAITDMETMDLDVAAMAERIVEILTQPDLRLRLGRRATEKVLERIRRIASGTYTDELAALTPQEQKILILVAEGKTNKEIAADVFLSDKTVKNYVSSILAKLNLERRAQAAAFVANRRTGGTNPG